MDASKTSIHFRNISDDVISKSRSMLVFSGELDESVLSELHATWRRKMIQGGVISGTVETLSASIPTPPVIAPLQTHDSYPLPGNAETGIDINAQPHDPYPITGNDETGIDINVQPPSTDIVMSIKNESDRKKESGGLYIPQKDGPSDGYYVPQQDIVTKPNPYDKDDEILNDEDDVGEEEVINEDTIQHLIMSQFDNVKRRKSKWECKLKAGVMQINGKSILFSEAKGDFIF